MEVYFYEKIIIVQPGIITITLYQHTVWRALTPQNFSTASIIAGLNVVQC
jgi:2-C-methyl-D-erythritol 4-phosphate cytidylyltransferase